MADLANEGTGGCSRGWGCRRRRGAGGGCTDGGAVPGCSSLGAVGRRLLGADPPLRASPSSRPRGAPAPVEGAAGQRKKSDPRPRTPWADPARAWLCCCPPRGGAGGGAAGAGSALRGASPREAGVWGVAVGWGDGRETRRGLGEVEHMPSPCSLPPAGSYRRSSQVQ